MAAFLITHLDHWKVKLMVMINLLCVPPLLILIEAKARWSHVPLQYLGPNMWWPWSHCWAVWPAWPSGRWLAGLWEHGCLHGGRLIHLQRLPKAWHSLCHVPHCLVSRCHRSWKWSLTHHLLAYVWSWGKFAGLSAYLVFLDNLTFICLLQATCAANLFPGHASSCGGVLPVWSASLLWPREQLRDAD